MNQPAIYKYDTAACPVCGEDGTTGILSMPQLPVFCNVLWDTRDAAVNCDKGDIELRFCNRCSFVFNAAFDPELVRYTPRYDNCLHFSSKFQQYAEGLAASLVNKHDLRGKTVIDVGCGKGDFLKLLCETGPNRGRGYDPSFEDREDFESLGDDIVITADYYSEQYAGHGGDFLSCRHVLEHIEKPSDLLDRISAGLGNRGGVPVFFEVPNGAYTIRNVFVWDVIYEHPSYFTPVSASILFAQNGFDKIELGEEFEGQYLGIHARTSGSGDGAVEASPGDITELKSQIAGFSDKTKTLFQTWAAELERAKREGRKTVIWGAGSKGVTFLNLLDSGRGVQFAVDLSPSKHGKYIAGTGAEIVPPEFLPEYQPDDIIVMNPVYQDEIRTRIREMGIEASVRCL